MIRWANKLKGSFEPFADGRYIQRLTPTSRAA